MYNGTAFTITAMLFHDAKQAAIESFEIALDTDPSDSSLAGQASPSPEQIRVYETNLGVFHLEQTVTKGFSSATRRHSIRHGCCTLTPLMAATTKRTAPIIARSAHTDTRVACA